MTRYLVTGGSGYFGSLVVARLNGAGHAVRVLDLNDAYDRPRDVEFVRGDVRDRAVVRDALDGVDVVLNNVAQVPLAKDRELLRTVNVDGTVNLLRGARAAGVSKVIHTSSSAVFGVPKSNPVMPNTVPAPMEAYGHAKLAAEWACLAAARDGLDVSIVRPRTILGHGRLGIFGILFEWIADGCDPIVLGDGTNRYQFVHADDLAEVCVLASERDGPEMFNVGAERFSTMRDTVAALCTHAETGATVRSVPSAPTALAMRATAALGVSPFAPYHWMMYSKSMWFDLDHLREQLGWSPRWSTDEMFAHSYDHFVTGRAAGLADERTADTTDVASHHRRSSQQGILRVAKRLSRLLPEAG